MPFNWFGAKTEPKPTVLDIRYFTLHDGEDISPPSGKQWTIRSIVCDHITGTMTVVNMYNNGAQHPYFFREVIIATAANDQSNLDLKSSTIVLDEHCTIDFAGAVTAFITVTVLEEPLNCNIHGTA